jgi:hypothetical protein
MMVAKKLVKERVDGDRLLDRYFGLVITGKEG